MDITASQSDSPDERIFKHIPRESLEILLKGIAETGSISVRFADKSGRTLCGPYGSTLLCKKYNHKCRADLCSASAQRQADKLIAAGGDFATYECAGDGETPGVTGAGLWDAVIPFYIRGEHMANILCGQVMFETPDKRRLATFRQFAESKLHLEGAQLNDYVKCAKKVPIVTQEHFTIIVRFFYWLANTISRYASDQYLSQHLHRLSQLQSNSGEQVVAEVVRALSEIAPNILGVNLFYFDGRRSLALRATSFDPANVARRSIQLDNSVCGRALRDGDVIEIDPLSDPNFHDETLINAYKDKMGTMLAIPFVDQTGGKRHLGAVALFLKKGAMASAVDKAVIQMQYRTTLESTLYRQGEQQRISLVTAAKHLLASDDSIWPSVDKILGEAVPGLVAYIVYMADEYGEEFAPVHTGVMTKANLNTVHLRKAAKIVFEEIKRTKDLYLCHDAISESSNALRGLLLIAMGKSKDATYGVGLIGAPLMDEDKRILGGLVAVTSRSGEAVAEYPQCTVFPTFSQRHVEAFEGTASVLSLVMLMRRTEEAHVRGLAVRYHELVAPMHAIKGFHYNLSWMFSENIKPDTKASTQDVAKFERQLDRMGELCDLLELVAISGSIEGPSSVYLSSFEDEVLLAVVPPLRAYSIFENGTQVFYGDEFRTMPPLFLSVDRIKRCMFNLVFNAVKYATPQSRIHVRLWEFADSYSVQVVNKGIGVPEGEEEIIFRKFKQGSNSDMVAAYGCGLGLWIARQIAMDHGGDVVLVDGSPSNTVFALILPKSLKYDKPNVSVPS